MRNALHFVTVSRRPRYFNYLIHSLIIFANIIIRFMNPLLDPNIPAFNQSFENS